MKTVYPQILSINFLLFCVGFLLIQASAYATLPTLKYLGHASVKIRTSEGITIYIDPFSGTDYADSADIVLITHEHSDHNALNLVRQKTTCQVIRSSNAIQGGVYQTFTIGDITVKAVAAYNGILMHDKNSCVGYVVEFDSIKVYHAGDTGKIPEMADLSSQNISYALLPIDGQYTMTPAEATEAASMINAIYSIPIHIMSANVALFTPTHKIVLANGESIVLADRYNILPYLYKPIPAQIDTVGHLFSFQIPDSTFLDNDIGDTLTYQATGLPAWLSFDPQTRTFQGTPPQQTGLPISLPIVVIATDLLQASASTSFVLSVVRQSAHIAFDMSAGWHLVSVPSLQSNYSAETLFPGKYGSMFAYNMTLQDYVPTTTLTNGRGYWVCYLVPNTITMSGLIMDPLTITTAQSGWILIGSRETDIPLSSLVLSDGIIYGSGFRYNNIIRDYEETAVIKAGEGVWIYVTKPCTITIP